MLRANYNLSDMKNIWPPPTLLRVLAMHGAGKMISRGCFNLYTTCQKSRLVLEHSHRWESLSHSWKASPGGGAEIEN